MLLTAVDPVGRNNDCSTVTLGDPLVADAAQALNALDGARAGRPLCVNGNPKEIDYSSLTPLQRSVVQRLARQVEELSPPPGDLQREEALSELLHCDDFYHMHRNTPLAPAST